MKPSDILAEILMTAGNVTVLRDYENERLYQITCPGGFLMLLPHSELETERTDEDVRIFCSWIKEK